MTPDQEKIAALLGYAYNPITLQWAKTQTNGIIRFISPKSLNQVPYSEVELLEYINSFCPDHGRYATRLTFQHTVWAIQVVIQLNGNYVCTAEGTYPSGKTIMEVCEKTILLIVKALKLTIPKNKIEVPAPILEAITEKKVFTPKAFEYDLAAKVVADEKKAPAKKAAPTKKAAPKKGVAMKKIYTSPYATTATATTNQTTFTTTF